MSPILKSPITYISFIIFYMSYLIPKKLDISESISVAIPSLLHSLTSTFTSAVALVVFNNDNYYTSCSIMLGYFLSDSIHAIQKMNKPGRKGLLMHHIFSISGILLPPNYWIIYAIFLTESSNVFGQITYLLIKTKQSNKVIMKSKQYQYWSFLIERIFLLPFVFLLPDENITKTSSYLMYVIFAAIYSMSIFWMTKIHFGYYK